MTGRGTSRRPHPSNRHRGTNRHRSRRVRSYPAATSAAVGVVAVAAAGAQLADSALLRPNGDLYPRPATTRIRRPASSRPMSGARTRGRRRAAPGGAGGPGPVSELIAEAQQRGVFIRYVEPIEITRISPIESHQGVVAIVEGKAGVELEEFLLHLDGLSEPALVLAIDSLQDPQNFGVLLRSAEGTGVDGVIIPKHRAVGITPAVAKTSAGASEHLMIADVANLRQAIDALKEKGIWVVGTDEAGDLLYDEVDYRRPTAIVIRGEAQGIRRLLLQGGDHVERSPLA